MYSGVMDQTWACYRLVSVDLFALRVNVRCQASSACGAHLATSAALHVPSRPNSPNSIQSAGTYMHRLILIAPKWPAMLWDGGDLCCCVCNSGSSRCAET